MAAVNVEEVIYKFLAASNDSTKGSTIQTAIDAGLSLADVATVIVDGAAQAAHITDASVAHALNSTFSDTEVEAALDALGTKINAILDALEGAGIVAAS